MAQDFGFRTVIRYLSLPSGISGGSGRFDFPTAAAMSVLVVPLVALVLFWILRIRRLIQLNEKVTLDIFSSLCCIGCGLSICLDAFILLQNQS